MAQPNPKAAPGKSPPRKSPQGKARKSSARTPFLRLLPLLILVGALMLSVRINDIRKGIGNVAELRVAGELQAQQSDDRAPQQLAEAKAEPEAAPAAAPAPVPAAEQANLSQTEMDVLQRLSDRRSVLDGRERDIERREALLKAAESQIERKIAEMKTLQNTIEGLLRQYNEQEDNKMRSLVKIYENMKPKDAAKIFEQLDMPILLDVVERMKEQRVAPILAEMDPSKARTVTSELAQRRSIPMPKPASGG